MKWVGILAAIIVIISCFYPWIVIPSKDIIISGINASGTNYGKPGYMNFLLSGIYIVLALFPKLWARRANLFFAALNFAWSLRNFILLARCEGGECPSRQPAVYILLIASFIMLVGITLAPLTLKEKTKDQ